LLQPTDDRPSVLFHERIMPKVTFSSPVLEHAVTVKADTEQAILSLAEANNIPLPRACHSGDCAACTIEVLTLSGKTIGSELTEKEKRRLPLDGRLSIDELRLAEQSEVAPRYRLACQYMVGFEDILVWFSGKPGDA
jgi:ferredoxin